MIIPEFTLLPPLPHRHQQGVVLIIALIMLVVVSMLAVLSMRNSSSTEAISGTVRTTSLATQAAEIALRYCEESTRVVMGTSAFVTTFSAANVLSPLVPGSTPAWQNLSTWDSSSTATFVLPTEAVKQSVIAATYSRMPECMVQPLPTLISGALSNTTTFVITARGFGPDVAVANASRSRPVGTEVWLQSTIELGSSATSSSGGGTIDTGDYDGN